jgi:hypothetical protein
VASRAENEQLLNAAGLIVGDILSDAQVQTLAYAYTAALAAQEGGELGAQPGSTLEDVEREHEEFLRSYSPVITRLPAALAAESGSAVTGSGTEGVQANVQSAGAGGTSPTSSSSPAQTTNSTVTQTGATGEAATSEAQPDDPPQA